MSYTPAQIDDVNLAYWYQEEQHDQGLYYRAKDGIPAVFPAGFWASQRSTQQASTAAAQSSSISNAPNLAPASTSNNPRETVPTTTTATASTSAAPASISHIVALEDTNREHFVNNTSTFQKMRVTIHTTGAWPNSVHSDNHVTILLILARGGAVQIDMRTDDDDRRGQLLWKLVNYQHSRSEIKHIDYDLGAPVQVRTLYWAIRYDWKLHQYLFSAGGSGCHFWNYTLLRKMTEDTTKFSLNPSVPAHVLEFFGKWYSTSGVERENRPIRQGTFMNYTEWWTEWFGEDEEDEEE